MTNDAADITATNLKRLLHEVLAPFEIARYRLDSRRLEDLPKGDGHAVMFVPGFGFGEEVLKPLMRTIENLGYTVYGWGEGRNLGMRPSIRRRLSIRIQELKHRHRSRISLVGWSLGGVFVRELARAQPELVRRVITIGSPINGYEVTEDFSGQLVAMLRKKLSKAEAGPDVPPSVAPPVPCTAIYSRTDGIVDWRASIEASAPNAENVEVHASHLGLLHNPEVVRAIADRLARTSRRARSQSRPRRA